MDDALFESVVDQMAGRDLDLVQPFLNNEPFTDPHILRRLEVLRARLAHVPMAITTNGLRLGGDARRVLARLGLDTIYISSHGLTPAVYRETMGIDAFTVLRNVNLLHDELRRHGARTRLVVSAVLLHSNRHEIRVQHDYWVSRGIEFYVNPLNDRAGNIPEPAFVRLLPLDAARRGEHLRRYDMSGCPALDQFMGILWNGDVVSCCMDWRRARVLGNARRQSLEEIWTGEPYARLRGLSAAGRLAEETLCRDCGQNRFSIGADALPRGAAGGPVSGDAGVLRVLAEFEHRGGVLQMGMVRS
jgi:MoaA/NifB/PqqE/SkfB family radical SAM enzyme